MSEDDSARAARAAATLAEARELIGRTSFVQSDAKASPEPETSLRRELADALAAERERQRAVQAEIVAHLQREFDGALTDLRAEFEAQLLAAGDAIAAEDGPAKVLN